MYFALSIIFMPTHICHPHSFSWFMCCEHALITCLNILVAFILILVIYVLQTCRDHSILIHSCDLCAANMSWLLVWMFYRFDVMFILVIYVLRTCRDYLFEYFIRFHTCSCNVLRTCHDYLLDCLFALIKMWLKYTLPWKL